jgi:hypothetical protein
MFGNSLTSAQLSTASKMQMRQQPLLASLFAPVAFVDTKHRTTAAPVITVAFTANELLRRTIPPKEQCYTMSPLRFVTSPMVRLIRWSLPKILGGLTGNGSMEETYLIRHFQLIKLPFLKTTSAANTPGEPMPLDVTEVSAFSQRTLIFECLPHFVRDPGENQIQQLTEKTTVQTSLESTFIK